MYFPQPDDAEKTASLYFNVMFILYEKSSIFVGDGREGCLQLLSKV